jgi:uncharacterized protein YPO0396
VFFSVSSYKLLEDVDNSDIHGNIHRKLYDVIETLYECSRLIDAQDDCYKMNFDPDDLLEAKRQIEDLGIKLESVQATLEHLQKKNMHTQNVLEETCFHNVMLNKQNS